MVAEAARAECTSNVRVPGGSVDTAPRLLPTVRIGEANVADLSTSLRI